MALDIWNAITAVGSSGIIVYGRDWYLSRKTIQSTEKAEQRNSEREPIVRDGMLLSDAMKATAVFKEAIATLQDTNDRSTEELREAKSALGENIRNLSNENTRLRMSFEKDIAEYKEIVTALSTKIVKLEAMIENLKGTTSGDS